MMTRTWICFLLLLVSVPCFSSVLVYTDEAAWRSALSGSLFATDHFTGSRRDFAANVTESRDIVDITLLGGFSDLGPTGLTGSGYLQGEVDNDKDPLELGFHFDLARGFALGGVQNDSHSTAATLALDEILLTVAGESFVLADIAGQNIGDLPFIGFSGSDLFDGFVLSHASTLHPMTRRSEEFFIDRFILARSATVPAPQGWTLVLLGLFMLLGCRTRRATGPAMARFQSRVKQEWSALPRRAIARDYPEVCC